MTGSYLVCQTEFVVAINQDDLKQALEALGLTLPVTPDQLTAKRLELLQMWYPARYANLTNNPMQYMRLFKQAEEMTRRVESASKVVNEWLSTQDNHIS